ncbi:DNA-3-methyladenine glycosylase family protein [Martelella endophytica]|uniref:DNA-3-methyladenine glycosylase II n=1 Tax=Martelella endophytica TaxID=1486262 RepID=A0A0D5LQF4_MAREN|nr:DNA-3-methyladenine glycosylase [Martelella endophytica]AJY45573.1 DNA-3-methyladenine glycosidase [Martelella endophytica]
MQRMCNADDLKIATEALLRQAPDLAAIATACGPPPLRLMPAGFAGLAEVVAGQLISKQAAAAIYARLEQEARPISPQTYLALSPETHAAIGLTRAKQAALAGIAEAILSGELDLAALGTMDSAEATRALTRYRGIGVWTAEVYLMFCEGHADIFPAGDLALRAAAAHAFAMEKRPEIAALRARAETWRPWRSVAARLLWAYYANVMKRNVLPVG